MAYGFNADKSKKEIYQIKKKTFTYNSFITYGEVGEQIFNFIRDICRNVVKIVENTGDLNEFHISYVKLNNSGVPTEIMLNRWGSFGEIPTFISEMWNIRKNSTSDIYVRKSISMSPDRWNYMNVSMTFDTNYVLKSTESLYYSSGVEKTIEIYYFDEVKDV